MAKGLYYSHFKAYVYITLTKLMDKFYSVDNASNIVKMNFAPLQDY